MITCLFNPICQAIENELVERLNKKVYGDIYNYPEKEFNKILDMEQQEAASEEEEDEEEEVIYTSLVYVFCASICSDSCLGL